MYTLITYPQSMRPNLTELKTDLEKPTILRRDFSILLSITDRNLPKSLKIRILLNTINKLEATEILVAITPAKCTFLSSAHGILSQIDYVLRQIFKKQITSILHQTLSILHQT